MLRWALGYVEICLNQHCRIWYGYKGGHLKCLQRLTYFNTSIDPFTALPLVAYCTLLTICLPSGKFIIPMVCYNNFSSPLPPWILFWNYHFYWFNIPCGIMCNGFNYTTMNCWARHCWPKILSLKLFFFMCGWVILQVCGFFIYFYQFLQQVFWKCNGQEWVLMNGGKTSNFGW